MGQGITREEVVGLRIELQDAIRQLRVLSKTEKNVERQELQDVITQLREIYKIENNIERQELKDAVSQLREASKTERLVNIICVSLYMLILAVLILKLNIDELVCNQTGAS